MNMKKILLLIVMTLFAASALLAQEKDSVDLGDWDAWKEKRKDREDNIKFNDFSSKGKPTISVNYGFSQLTHDKLSAAFADPGMIELKLGYTNEDTIRAKKIIKHSSSFLSLSNSSNEFGDAVPAGIIESETWRIELGRSSGYGYKFGNGALIPYYSNSLSWAKIDVSDSLPTADDQKIIDRFDAFRFGTATEGGIKLRFIKNLAVEIGYERAMIFERHLFWKWAGSALIEAGGQWALDAFIGEIIDSSPYAAPIVNFVLKNALSYGIYELRKEKMNWPFSSAPPLMYNQFKIGLTFIF